MVEGTQGWANGGDPEEYGWVFTETRVNVDAYTLCYETPTREAAEGLGIPASILDRFEDTQEDKSHPQGYGWALCEYLQS